MKLIGYITRRDEDGTWYLNSYEEWPDGEIYGSWTQTKPCACHVSPDEALKIMEKSHQRGYHSLMFHAVVTKSD